jgi:hypothetical protein
LRASIGKKLEVTGKALRDSIVEECGGNLSAYITKKSLQLNELDFEPQRYEASMTFQAGTYGELVDAFLGLKKIEVKDFAPFENRFGIKLPLEKVASGVMHIQPQPAGKCLIIFRGGDIHSTIILY